MLAQLGSVQMEVWPLNLTETSLDSEATFAEKSVMGRRPPLEFIGPGAETRTLKCKLFPGKFGGLSSLQRLQAQQTSGLPMPFMRGDGTALGWFVIEKISERASYLDRHGVGQVIELDVTVKRSDPPRGGAIFSIIGSLG